MQIRNVLHRQYYSPEDFERNVSFYEKLLNQKARLRFEHPAAGLRLAQVANLLFIGGPEEAIEPFRTTACTFLVDDIQAFSLELPKAGCEIVRPVKEVPTGWNMLVRHLDGMLAEYVQHAAPHPDDDVLGMTKIINA